jgi:small subunit ribosomal protein S1
MKFGAFVQLAEGVEGMVHVSDISAEKRIEHPQDVLKVGQVVKAQVLEMDEERRRVKLGMKQLAPTSVDEYIAEHKVGDVVTGRVVDDAGRIIELGEGIQAKCRVPVATVAKQESQAEPKLDLSSLGSMLQARWKGTAKASSSKPDPIRAGQIRSFRITNLDAKAKTIDVELN